MVAQLLYDVALKVSSALAVLVLLTLLCLLSFLMHDEPTSY